MDFNRLCMGCMGERGDALVCPLCGYDENQKISPLALAPRTVLNQQYLIGRVLGSPGGFGVTYLAWDISLATAVAIKEYMPRALVTRDLNRSTVLPHSQGDEELFRYGLEQFLDEARLLAQFDHLNIVRVRSFFEANATGYLVMDYYRGMNLSEYLKQNGKMLAKPALWVLMPILDGLREVHERNILHRDIKPQNIYIIAERRRPILLDFGAARAAVQGRSQGLTAVLTEGFAPYEQYDRHGRQGPWTDIYACGATLYLMLTGQVPPPALERKLHDKLVPLDQLVSDVPPSISSAVMQALAVEPQQRPQDVRTFQSLLTGNGEIRLTSTTSVSFAEVECPQCRVKNRVPAGYSLADVKCTNCATPLNGAAFLSGHIPPTTPVAHTTLYTSAFTMMTRKGQTIAVATVMVLLLLGGGIWAKQSYDRSLAEEQAKRSVLEQQLKQKEVEAAQKAAEEKLSREIEQARREKDEETRKLSEEKVKQEAEAKRLAEENKRLRESMQATTRQQRVAPPADPVDPEVAEMERERRRAEAQARREEAARRAELARERREEQRQLAEERRQEREEAARSRAEPRPSTPAATPSQGTGTLDSLTDMACKFWGNCDARFRSNNR